MKQQVNIQNSNLNRDEQTIIMHHEASNSVLEIAPNQGGRIVKLVVDNTEIISEPLGILYSDSYAASLLFPFPNRIEDGIYNFDNKEYTLDCNQIKEHNALHGLIYNQKFQVVKQHQDDEKLIIVLKYFSNGTAEGFPFKYDIEVTYQLHNQQLSCEMKVTNSDTLPFPFAMGWHPYFLASDTSETTLHFKSKNHLINNHRNIPVEVKPRFEDVTLQFNQLYDDCFELSAQEVEFKTPDYTMFLEVGEVSKYLQIYTPEGKNVIAIEPMTAPANSFNNGLGLQILEPGASHSETWILKIVKPTLN